MRQFSSLAASFLTLAGKSGHTLAQAEESNNMYFPVSFDVGGAVVLSELMQNPDVFNDVLDHGCHCSLLDLNSNQDILGGHEPLDELDGICRQWLIARNCNDRLIGGACYGAAIRDMTYTVYEDLDYIPHCEPTESECKSSACKIDLYYATQIMDWVMWNPFEVQRVTNEGTCQWTELPSVNRVCEGQAPDVQIRVLGETLTHRILNTVELKQECSDAIFDITILIDGSGSVLPPDYQGSMDFIEQLLDMFTISDSSARITLAQFSSDLLTYTTMDNNEASVAAQLDLMRRTQFRKGTMTNDALDQMLNSIETYGRADARQFLLILTDGTSNNGVTNAERLHENDVTIFSIGVGTGIDPQELSDMASEPENEYLYMIDDFNVLNDIYMMLTIGSNICIKAKLDDRGGATGAAGEDGLGLRAFGNSPITPPSGVIEWENPNKFPTDEDVVDVEALESEPSEKSENYRRR